MKTKRNGTRARGKAAVKGEKKEYVIEKERKEGTCEDGGGRNELE